MKKVCQISALTLIAITLLFSSCKKDKTVENIDHSFLPMQVGNLWYLNDQNYTEIKEKITIDSKVYYKFYSLVGGDAISTVYLRIDEKNRLVESYPTDPTKIYIRADFNANVGDKFFTTGDQGYNDYEVTVVKKTATEMTFSYDAIYHPNLKGHPHQVSYIKGKGFPGNWKKLVINGNILLN